MTSPAPEIQCRMEEGFAKWLVQSHGTVAVTTYQAGKVALASWDGKQLAMLLRQFDKPMGLAVRDDQLALVLRDSVLLFADSPHQAREFPIEQPAGHDRLYLPRVQFNTCELQIHDVAFCGEELWIANTRFSCLATLSHTHAFEPKWKPAFVSDLVPEDRCHLNGLALVDDKPRFVTALGETDSPRGWSENRATGGVLIDVESQQIVVRGLCMPHSPRWHDGKLWLLESGKGQLCVLEPGDSRPTAVCALPGYARGLCFVGDCALVGLSLVREKHLFGGMPIGEDNSKLRCGVAAVDVSTGKFLGMLVFTAGCEELYDVRFLPGTKRPMLLSLDQERSRQAIPTPDFAYWMIPQDQAR